MQTADTQRAKAWQLYQLLLRTYGQRPLQPRREPVHELISTMLSDRTTPQNEEIAFEHLWMRFGSWAAIRDAPLTTLAESIALVTFPETKAANIKKTLAQIIDLRGEASLDFLQELPTAGGLAWLLELPGVGLKTASLVLLFCFSKPLLPVDTHVHRVSQRLGLIGPKVTTEAAHKLLLELLPPEPPILYNFYVNMVRHGQRICKWDTPLCPRCPLQGLCRWYATH